MGETRRLHPAAVPIYSAQALRNAAFPLLIIVGATLLGGSLDTRGLMRALIYGGIGLAVSVVMGFMRWQSTTYSISADAIHHHTGILATKDTDIPLARLEALDVHQGPLQRLFGVLAVDVQTGAAGKGGEISLPALTPEAVAELRAARPDARDSATDEPTGPRRTLAGRSLVVAALTAGQLGIILPLLAGVGQIAGEFANPDNGEEAVRLLPHSVATWIAGAAGLLVLAWLLSTLGAIVTFAGFTVTRDGARLRIRRGFVSRSEATVPVARIRAVRVVEGIFRRPFGLATLQVEVLGYAEEASASRTLFPLVRVRESARSWPNCCRSSRTTPAPSPARHAGPRAATSWPLCSRASSPPRRRSRSSAPTASSPSSRARSTAAPAGPPPAGTSRTAASPSARCNSPASPSSPPRPSASPTHSPRPHSSAARTSPTSRSPSASRPRPASATSSTPTPAKPGPLSGTFPKGVSPFRGCLGDAEAVEQGVVGAPGAADADGEVEVDALGQLALESPCGRRCRWP